MGRALSVHRRLEGCYVAVPRAFLAGIELECGFERLHALFHMRFACLWVRAVVLSMRRGLGGGGSRCIGRRGLCKGGHRQGGEHGGHDGTALQEGHGVFLSC